MENETSDRKPDPPSLREKKIQQYKRKKELEEREKTLKPAIERLDYEESIVSISYYICDLCIAFRKFSASTDKFDESKF